MDIHDAVTILNIGHHRSCDEWRVADLCIPGVFTFIPTHVVACGTATVGPGDFFFYENEAIAIAKAYALAFPAPDPLVNFNGKVVREVSVARLDY